MTFSALIIDDNQANINALVALIKREGGACIAVNSPADALDALNHQPSMDVVFLDFEFPNYNGLEWVAMLKADPRLANIPFVAYTVHTSEQNEAWTAGFHSFIGKPLNVEKFPGHLAQILQGIPVWVVE